MRAINQNLTNEGNKGFIALLFTLRYTINQNIVDIPSDDEFMLPLTPPIGGLNWKPTMNFRQL